MPDAKLTTLTQLTDARHDDELYAVDDPNGTPASRALTIKNALRGGSGENVLHYGAGGDSNSSVGGGADDTAEIQAAYDAAYASGGSALVLFPGRRTYRITSTINVPEGVMSLGLGGYDGIGEAPPTILWDGNNSTPMLLVTSSDSNIFTTSFHNLCIRGSANLTNRPTAGIQFARSGGGIAKCDSGTFFDNVWIQVINGHGVQFADGGTTNCFWRGGRFDAIYGGYGIYVPLTTANSEAVLQIMNLTWVNYYGTTPAGKGFLHLDGEGVTGASSSIVSISGLHTECNVNLVETFASGTNPYDRRGIIRLGVSPSQSFTQHRLDLHGIRHAPAPGVNAHCFFQITANTGTDADAADAAMITLDNGSTMSDGTSESGSTSEVRIFGGKVPTTRRFPFSASNRTGRITWGQGRDNNSEGVRSFLHQRHGSYVARGLTLLPETVADLGFPVSAGAIAYITDATAVTLGSVPVGGGSNKVQAMYDGSSWRITAKVQA